MPRLTRVYVKTGLAYLVVALCLGFLTSLRLEGFLPVGAGPVYIHLLTIGWLTQLIVGVAFWMFPRYSRERPRGYEGLLWAAYGLFNMGLILRAVAEPSIAVDDRPVWGRLLVAAACCLWLGGMLVAVHFWPRVKER